MVSTTDIENEIVDVLKEHEEDLSDGFGYYCDDVDETLHKIAKKIISLAR